MGFSTEDFVLIQSMLGDNCHELILVVGEQSVMSRFSVDKVVSAQLKHKGSRWWICSLPWRVWWAGKLLSGQNRLLLLNAGSQMRIEW